MLLATVPPLGRSEAAARAADELARPGYARSWQDRALDAASELLRRLVDEAAEVTPGGLATLLLVGVLLVGAALALRGRLALRSASGPGRALDTGLPTTAADARAAADVAARDGRWRDALRERLRAVGRELEERGLLLPRPSRTAGELAREAGRVLPDVAAELVSVARRFEDVEYGGAAATEDDDARARAVDAAVVAARPAALTIR